METFDTIIPKFELVGGTFQTECSLEIDIASQQNSKYAFGAVVYISWSKIYRMNKDVT